MSFLGVFDRTVSDSIRFCKKENVFEPYTLRKHSRVATILKKRVASMKLLLVAINEMRSYGKPCTWSMRTTDK
jgi:hypothetical protein